MDEISTPTVLTTLPFDTHPLSTERLLLRPLTEADIEDVFAYQSVPDVVRFLPWPVRTLEESAEHTRERARMTRLENDQDALVFGIEMVGESESESDNDNDNDSDGNCDGQGDDPTGSDSGRRR
jgi:RimJ/RimL family protein N-acetyltransferase